MRRLEKYKLLIYSLLSEIDKINLNDIYKSLNIDLTDNESADFKRLVEKAKYFTTPIKSYPDQVRSIFSIINTSNPSNNFYPFSPFFIDKENVFVSDNDSTENNYDTHIYEFVEKVKNIKTTEIKTYYDSLFHLCKQYLWSVPSNAKNDAISLFELIKTQTAFVSCLNYIENSENKNQEYPFLMLCVDISGIQNFVYNIHSSKAAMSLKGRSFYLQLLVNTIIQYILNYQHIELSKANIIYSSGGKAYLLLPNTESVVKSLKEIEGEIIKNVFDDFQDSIYICLDYLRFNLQSNQNGIKVSSDELDSKGKEIKVLNQLWERVSDKTSNKKKSKLKSLLKTEFKKIFRGENLENDFNGVGMTNCAVTGIPVRINPRNKLNNTEDIYVLPIVKEQFNLGRNLRNQANYYETTQIDKSYLTEINNWVEPIELGIFHQVRNYSKLNYISELNIINPSNIENSVDFQLSEYSSQNFIFYGGNQQALNNDGNIKEFEDLAEPDTGKSFKKLAILRMDVDNLGQIFINGFKNDDSLFPLYSTLSTQLDWFFSGYLNTIRNSTTYVDWVNIIYSGGDDIFAIGRWDKIIEFTHEVRKDFQEFVCNRVDISISAGISIVSPKFPISKAADLAANALDEAKDYKKENSSINNEPDKNAIHLLGTTISWDKEYDFVNNLQQKLIELLDAKVISKGFLYKLFVYQNLKDNGKRDWWWQSAYSLARFEKSAKNLQLHEQAEIVKAIKTALASGDFTLQDIKLKRSKERILDLLCLSAKLADYYTR